MNFKSSIRIIFSFLILTCFADQEVFYNPDGIYTITKMIRKGIDDKNLSEQLCFAEGLTRFCKEKGIKEGDVIAIRPNKSFLTKNRSLKLLKLSNPHFPSFAFINHLEQVFAVNGENLVKAYTVMTPEMEKFVQEMIEKGKSINQIQATN